VLKYVNNEKDVFQIEVIPVTERFQDLGVMNYAELEGTGIVFVPTLDEPEQDIETQTSLPWWLRDTYTDTATCDESDKQAQHSRFCCFGPIAFPDPYVPEKVVDHNVLAQKRKDLKQNFKENAISNRHNKQSTHSESHIGGDISKANNASRYDSQHPTIYIKTKVSPRKLEECSDTDRRVSQQQQQQLGPVLPSLTPSPTHASRRLKYDRVFFPDRSGVVHNQNILSRYQFDKPSSTMMSDSEYIVHDGVPMRKNDIVDCTLQEEYERVRKLNEVMDRHDQVSSASRASSSNIADSYQIRGHFESNEGESSCNNVGATIRKPLHLHAVPDYIQRSNEAYASRVGPAIIEGIPSTLGTVPIVSGLDVVVGVDYKGQALFGAKDHTSLTSPLAVRENPRIISPFAKKEISKARSPIPVSMSKSGGYADSPIHVDDDDFSRDFKSKHWDEHLLKTPSSRTDMITRHRLDVQSLQNSTGIDCLNEYGVVPKVEPVRASESFPANESGVSFEKSTRSSHLFEYNDPSNSLKDDDATSVTKNREDQVSSTFKVVHVDTKKVDRGTSPLASCLDFDFSLKMETPTKVNDKQDCIAAKDSVSAIHLNSPPRSPLTLLSPSKCRRDDLKENANDPRSPKQSPASEMQTIRFESPNLIESQISPKSTSKYKETSPRQRPPQILNLTPKDIERSNRENLSEFGVVSVNGLRSDCPIEVHDLSCEITDDRYPTNEVINLIETDDENPSIQHIHRKLEHTRSDLPNMARNWADKI
jgi:hypothetical protein